MDVEEIREFIGADSLAYLSIGGVLSAIDLPRDRFCFACFDGHYPVPVPYDVASPQVRAGGAATVPAAVGQPDRRVTRARAAAARTRATRRPAWTWRPATARWSCCVRARRRRRGGPDLLGGLGGFGAALELPAGYARAGAGQRDGRRGHQDGDRARRWGGSTRSARTWSRCAPTTWSAPAPSRSSSWTTSRSGGSIPERVAALVGGIADGCALAGCALVGGETAEHPGLMEPDAFDLAGFCVGHRGARPAARRLGGARRRRGRRPRVVRAPRERLLAGAARSSPARARWTGRSGRWWRGARRARAAASWSPGPELRATWRGAADAHAHLRAATCWRSRAALAAAGRELARRRPHHRRRAAGQPAAGAARSWAPAWIPATLAGAGGDARCSARSAARGRGGPGDLQRGHRHGAGRAGAAAAAAASSLAGGRRRSAAWRDRRRS